ncbi:hypothetical protein K1T71_003147 [Dendrolimus kikuchii]|uniref:Uncharacterized protein n=1 Tax=Dendrolimus kikuchii TaxID=765133 RepID=A0ACC1DBU1_9NEOP|nr:hypothetical protein K1T71_003147 [Dendrolimus kikuchii]
MYVPVLLKYCNDRKTGAPPTSQIAIVLIPVQSSKRLHAPVVEKVTRDAQRDIPSFTLIVVRRPSFSIIELSLDFLYKMSHGRLSQSIILEKLLKKDEEESESELRDQSSETSDHIVAEEPLSAEESNWSDSEEDDLQLYAGKQPEGPYQLSNAASDVVKRLITPISGTGRNLSINNWYTSVPLTND